MPSRDSAIAVLDRLHDAQTRLYIEGDPEPVRELLADDIAWHEYARPSSQGAFAVELPIVCTLNPALKRDRLAWVDALAADALRSREPIEGGLRHRFRAGDDVERRVRELAALESECCAFLSFEVSREADAVLLDVTGSAEAQPVIDQLLAG